MAKERLYSSLSELPDNSPIIINPQERAFNPQQSFDYETLGKYDAGLYPGMNQEYNRGANQRGWNLLPTAIGRFIGSTITKTLSGAASTLTGFSENAITKEIDAAEKHILDEWFPVYRTEEMDSDSLIARIKEPGWWASTATDGFAFMASAILGAKGVNAVSKFGSIGRAAKALGASDDILMKMDKVSRSTVGKLLGLEKGGVGVSTAYNAFTEAFFESKGVLDSVKNQVSQEKYGGDFDYLSPEQQADVMQIAGDAAQKTFWYNVPMLMFSERIFNETILGNFFGLPSLSAASRITKEGNELLIKSLTKGQKAALYGLPFAANVPTEMLQENYQLAVEHYFSKNAMGLSSESIYETLQGIGSNMLENFSTIEGKESMFLGAFLGGAGAVAGTARNIISGDKYAKQYIDILQGHYASLNNTAFNYFETNNDGSIKMENGQPVVKNPKKFEEDLNKIKNNVEKYNIYQEYQILSSLGDVNAKDVLDVATENRLSELAFQLFQSPDSDAITNDIIESTADKYVSEMKQMGETVNRDAKIKELKDKIDNLRSIYNIADTYYKISSHKESVALQYHSLVKQDIFKNKYKKFKKEADEIISQLPVEDKIIIEDNINNPTSKSNSIIDNIITKNEKNLINLDNAVTQDVIKEKIAKTLAYKSLYNTERTRFEKEYTNPEYYDNLKKTIEETKQEDEKKQAKEEDVSAKKNQRKEQINNKKSQKDKEKKGQDIPKDDKVVYKEDVLDEIKKNFKSTGDSFMDNEFIEELYNKRLKELEKEGYAISSKNDAGKKDAGKAGKEEEILDEITLDEDTGSLKEEVLAFIKSKPNASATTIKKQFDKDITSILEELVNEGLVDKIPSGKGFKYKAKEIIKEEENIETEEEEEYTEEETFEEETITEEGIDDKEINDANVKNNEVSLETDSLSEGHNTIAYRVIKMIKDFTGKIVKRKNAGEYAEMEGIENTAAMHSSVKKGDTIQIRVPKDYRKVQMFIDNKNQDTISFEDYMSNYTNANDIKQQMYENLPLEIVHNGDVIGYIHRVDWIDETNLIEKEDSLSFDEQRQQLRNLRQMFIKDNNTVDTEMVLTTKITSKSNGKILTNGKVKRNISEAVPNAKIVVVIDRYNILPLGKKEKQKIKNKKTKLIKGSVGFLINDSFFYANTTNLTEDDKNIIKSIILSNQKGKSNKLRQMINFIYIGKDIKPENIQSYIITETKKSVTKSRYKLAVSLNGNYYIYDNVQKTVFENDESMLDEFLKQNLKANISPDSNLDWAKAHIVTNIQEIPVVKGNQPNESTVFIQPVITFDLPQPKLNEKVKPEVMQSSVETTSDLMGEQVGTSNYSVAEGLIYYNNPDGSLIPVLNPEGKPVMEVIIADIKRREQEELNSIIPIKTEDVTIDGGESFDFTLTFRVSTFKDGSAIIRHIKSGDTRADGKSKKLNAYPTFSDFNNFFAEDLVNSKGIIKTELVKDDFTDKQSQKTKTAKEKTIKAKYDAERDSLQSEQTSDINSKIAEIERGRQEELDKSPSYEYDKKFKEFQTYGNTVREAFDNLFEQVKNNPTNKELSNLLDYINARLVPEDILQGSDQNPLVQEYIDSNQQTIEKQSKSTKSIIGKINAKYDAEYVEAVKNGEITKEQAMQALKQIGRDNSDAYAELASLEGKPTTVSNIPSTTVEESAKESLTDEVIDKFYSNFGELTPNVEDSIIEELIKICNKK